MLCFVKGRTAGSHIRKLVVCERKNHRVFVSQVLVQERMCLVKEPSVLCISDPLKNHQVSSKNLVGFVKEGTTAHHPSLLAYH